MRTPVGAQDTGPDQAARAPLRLDPPPEALVFRGVAEGFEQIVVPDVPLREGDLLVRVELATVCGSDRHTATGQRAEPTPLVLGHEQVGRVVALGPGSPPRTVDGLPLGVGDRVVWGVAVTCGDCRRCRRGLSNKCAGLRKYGHARTERGWELSGGFATHVHVVAGSDVVRVPDDLPAEVLAPASCATATVVAALEAARRELAGEVVVVSGCGMLGLTAVAMAHAAGAVVVGVDPDPARRARARVFGASTVAGPGTASLRAAIRDAAGARGRLDDGFAVALELSGAGEAISTLLETADTGAAIVLAGSVFPAPPVPLTAEQVVRGLLTITGVHNYRGEHLLRAVEFLRDADVDLFRALVGEVVPLAEAVGVLVGPARGDVRVGIRP